MIYQRINFRVTILPYYILFLCAASTSAQSTSEVGIITFPPHGATNVNPDTHLKLTFPMTPQVGNSGQIRVYDTADNRLVDVLDLSIPPGPTERTTAPKPPYISAPYQYVPGHFTNANTRPGTPSGGAVPTPDSFQLTIIGGFTDGFHFYPVIVHDKTATIYLHHNLLEYGKTYTVEIDPGVFTIPGSASFSIQKQDVWMFSTKVHPPASDAEMIVVSDDGGGDFNTVQGAMDFIPDFNKNRITVYVRNGLYEEIVYFRNKTNVTLIGEDREKVVIQYANKEAFNPHPSNIATNEVPGTFPSRRAAFAADNCSGIHLVNMTIRSTCERAQAEGLLLNGSENIVFNVNVGGSGDALQSNGSAYYANSRVDGWGDLVLGRGPAFFKDCAFSAFGPYMWIRNTDENHGNVFVNCRFETPEGKETVLARCPTNHGKNYPYTEAVLLNCHLSGIAPEGWGTIGDTKHVRYWEFNSSNLIDGSSVDVSRRHPASRQLTIEEDSATIAEYSDPTFVLGGWTPKMAPVILHQPKSVTAEFGSDVAFNVEVIAVPGAEYQWYHEGKVITGATNTMLKIEDVRAADAGDYYVIATNTVGTFTSKSVRLIIK